MEDSSVSTRRPLSSSHWLALEESRRSGVSCDARGDEWCRASHLSRLGSIKSSGTEEGVFWDQLVA